jgi:hypothetical protein
MKNKVLLFALLGMMMAVGPTSCGEDEETGIDGMKAGNISGTTWVVKESTSNSVARSEYTRTISFTSKNAGKYTKTGWYQISTLSGTKVTWGSKKTDNETDDFTYVYLTEKVAGYNGYITISGTEYPFALSEDFEKLDWTYYRKTFTLQ